MAKNSIRNNSSYEKGKGKDIYVYSKILYLFESHNQLLVINEDLKISQWAFLKIMFN